MRVLSLVFSFTALAGLVSAQQMPCTNTAKGPGCEAAPAPQCDYQAPPCQPVSQQTPPPQNQANGYYAAPPQTGVMQGPSQALEVEGLALRFPALEFKFPSLRLPSCSRILSQPKMLMEAAQAPYVQQPTAVYGAPITVQQVPPPPPPQQNYPPPSPGQPPPSCTTPQMAPNCNASIDWERQLRARDQKIEQLNQQICQMASSMERLTYVIDRMAAQPIENRGLTRDQDGIGREPIPATLPVKKPSIGSPASTETPATIRLSAYETEDSVATLRQPRVILSWQKTTMP